MRTSKDMRVPGQCSAALHFPWQLLLVIVDDAAATARAIQGNCHVFIIRRSKSVYQTDHIATERSPTKLAENVNVVYLHSSLASTYRLDLTEQLIRFRADLTLPIDFSTC